MQLVFHSLQMNKLTKAAHWPTGLPGPVYCKLHEPTVLTTGEDALTMHELLLCTYLKVLLTTTGAVADCMVPGLPVSTNQLGLMTRGKVKVQQF